MEPLQQQQNGVLLSAVGQPGHVGLECDQTVLVQGLPHVVHLSSVGPKQGTLLYQELRGVREAASQEAE